MTIGINYKFILFYPDIRVACYHVAIVAAAKLVNILTKWRQVLLNSVVVGTFSLANKSYRSKTN